jgi:methionyl-tRNA synthetase
LGQIIDPFWLADRYGSDALRWWVLRDVPRSGDADFREEQLSLRANELADDLGNLVNRTLTLIRRSRPDGPKRPQTGPAAAKPLAALRSGLPGAIDSALARCDLRLAASALWEVVAEANRLVSETRPWELAKAEAEGASDATERLDAILYELSEACGTIASEIEPFLPAAASRIAAALQELDTSAGRRLFTKFDATKAGSR